MGDLIWKDSIAREGLRTISFADQATNETLDETLWPEAGIRMIWGVYCLRSGA